MDQQQPGMTISPQNVPPQAAPPPTPQVTPPVAQPSELPPAQPPAPEPPNQWQFVAESAAEPQTSSAMPNTATRRNDSISWTSSEFIANDKSAGWYGLLGLAALIVAAGIFLLTHDLISAIVVIVAAILLGVFAGHKPRDLEYVLDDKGITIGQKFYGYESFKSFAVADEGSNSSIVLMPLKRFMPQLTIYYEQKDEDNIVDILADRLPMEEHRTDMVDRFIHRIRF